MSNEKDWKYTIICICRDATKVTPTCPTGVTPPYADIQPDFPLPLFSTRAGAFAIATDEAEDELESLCDGCDEGISFGIAEDDEFDKMRSVKICYYNHEDDTTYVVTERVIVPVAPAASETEEPSPELAENEMEKGFPGSNNGHSGYLITGIDKDTFIKWAALHADEIRALTSCDAARGNAVRFETFEGYPSFIEDLAKAFPGATIYGYGMWDIIGFESNRSAYSTSLDDCFEDDGNIRIDVRVTDSDTGLSFVFGDLIIFESKADVDKRNGHDTYKYLTSLLNEEEMAKVESEIKNCYRSLEED